MTRPRLSPVSSELAYRVPWAFDRQPHHCELRNLGRETLTGVTLALYGPGGMPTTAPATLAPGDVLELMLPTHDLARSTIGIVRWFRPDGVEYLWRVAF